MGDRQKAFLGIALEMGNLIELEKLHKVLKEMGREELLRKVEIAQSLSESKVMITERGYIDCSAPKVMEEER